LISVGGAGAERGDTNAVGSDTSVVAESKRAIRGLSFLDLRLTGVLVLCSRNNLGSSSEIGVTGTSSIMVCDSSS